MQNTWGTDINAVLGHIIGIPTRGRPKVILIATDGYVGPGRSDLIAKLGRTLALAALTHSGHTGDLQIWPHEIIQLPKP